MYAVNRSVVVLKPRQPFLDWLQGTPDWDFDLGLDSLRVDCTSFLIPECHELEDAVQFMDQHFAGIFELELESWESDTRLWPENRTLKLFWEWFEVEIHSNVIDLAEDEITDSHEACTDDACEHSTH
jgi:hypothetical protein